MDWQLAEPATCPQVETSDSREKTMAGEGSERASVAKAAPFPQRSLGPAQQSLSMVRCLASPNPSTNLPGQDAGWGRGGKETLEWALLSVQGALRLY